ncbi:MAG: spermine synthase [Candidatus Afipia apatlaquensis]|uniref:Spermine synthase n=1 Tax=Candidatus Afipia apatlaquensis TaxID=2712852 RepID=A0A7C9RGB1_9BRAD|nr:spermine synthase [Candidatus Afipia apatlaquensis]
MKSKNFIYLTSFFCGMTDMAIELSASRFLAPTFGTSSIIWTIIIGIIMISMSIGNVIGGRLADKQDNLDKLYSFIWIAAVWIAVIPLIGKYIVIFVVFVLMMILPSNLLTIGSTICCLVIFSLPLTILGMASPYLVKMGVNNLENSGKTTGEIYALSTIGSIIGTFIPTFLTIPIIGTSKTFLVFSLILNLICFYYFFIIRTRYISNAVTSIIVIALVIFPLKDSYAFWKNNILYEGESLYNYLQVSEDNDSVVLSTNVAFGVQSIYNKNQDLTGMYYDYVLMAPLFIKNMNFLKPIDTLILGFGTGTFAKESKRFFPNTKTDGVEIDQKIADLSKKYFGVKDDEAKIYINDGRTFLYSSDAKKYDVIMVDAYRDITIPFQMSTKEFFAEVKKHLKPGGVIVMNINMRSSKNTEINDYLCETIKSVMNKVYTCDMKDSYNTIVFASDDKNCRENYIKNTNEIDSANLLKNTSSYVSKNINEVTKSNHVFTDEVAPVEILGEKVLDDIVSSEVLSFKQELKNSGKGFSGILDMISK